MKNSAKVIFISTYVENEQYLFHLELKALYLEIHVLR